VKQSRVTLYFAKTQLIKIDDSAYAPDSHGDKADNNGATP